MCKKDRGKHNKSRGAHKINGGTNKIDGGRHKISGEAYKTYKVTQGTLSRKSKRIKAKRGINKKEVLKKI